MRLVAVVLLILGVLAIDTGLNLSGAPFSLIGMFQEWSTPSAVVAVPNPSPNLNPNPNASAKPSPTLTNVTTNLTLYAQNGGYTPRVLNATAGQAVKLQVVTKNTQSCALAFVIPELRMQKVLPTTGTVVFDIPAQPKGKVMRFSCSMGMYTGQIVFN